MNNLAFQIYGSTKSGIFQSTWDTTLVSALGAEQAAISATGTNWALNTGATNLNIGGYKHTAGSTTNLTTTLAAGIMVMYQVTYTVSGRTSGSVSINYGGVTNSGITSSGVVSVLPTATTAFSITPTSDFDGVISISVKQSSSATNQVKLPLPNVGTYNIWVDWGDGTYDNITSYNSVNTQHTYSAPGIYTIRITGDPFTFGFTCGGIQDRLKIKTISSWGKLKFIGGAFCSCSNLTLSGITDVPDLSTTTSLLSVFAFCPLITTIGRLNEWNMSTITSMQAMFYTSGNFNQYIGDWNVSNVTSMDTMFWATPFNNGYASGVAGSLNWNTVKVTTFSNMFAYNTGFNQDISAWNVNKVTSFGNMFLRCITFNNGNNTNVNPITLRPGIDGWDLNTTSNVALDGWMVSNGGPMIFNRNLNNWNTSKVTIMSNMFYNCGSFNNGLASGVANQLPWNTSACTSMSGMFQGASAFNSNLGTGTTPWNVSKVTNFAQMFTSTLKFNNGDNSASINDWNIGGDASVGNVVNMYWMFRGTTAFTRVVDNWNMTKVNSTNNMFSYINYNQPLANWERTGSTLANVVNMVDMFWGNGGFDQNIGNWNVSGVTNFSGFMGTKTPSTYLSTNLDAIYNGWIVNGVKPNLSISFGTAKYTAAGAAGRLTLTSAPNNWIITDGGL